MIALLTPSGGRFRQFELCMKFMQRQTYTGDVLWVIIDDCIPYSIVKIPNDFREKWTIVKVFPTPVWKHGQNTQSRNLAAGMEIIKNHQVDAVFMIEDDDYYRSNYLERMISQFGTYDVLGDMHTIYYNVRYRSYFVNDNIDHSSLFQVAFRPEMIPLFESFYNERFIDFELYKELNRNGFIKQKKVGFLNCDLAVGIKGMPGREGIGAGHNRASNMIPDPYMNYLKSIIQEDAKLYDGYYRCRGHA